MILRYKYFVMVYNKKSLCLEGLSGFSGFLMGIDVDVRLEVCP